MVIEDHGVLVAVAAGDREASGLVSVDLTSRLDGINIDHMCSNRGCSCHVAWRVVNCQWGRCRSGADVFELLAEMAFHSGGGFGEMFGDELVVKTGPGGEEIFFDCFDAARSGGAEATAM